jgi:hypothetical protein
VLPALEGARSLFGSVASPQLSLRRAAISVHIEQRRGVLTDSTSYPRGVPREGRSPPESRPAPNRLPLGQNSFLSGCMPIKRRRRPCRPHRLRWGLCRQRTRSTQCVFVDSLGHDVHSQQRGCRADGRGQLITAGAALHGRMKASCAFRFASRRGSNSLCRFFDASGARTVPALLLP